MKLNLRTSRYLFSFGSCKLGCTLSSSFLSKPPDLHTALEMSVGSLLWRGALTFPPHPHWQPMCQLVAFSAGVGVLEVQGNTEEPETQQKEKPPEKMRVYDFCVCVCLSV